MIRILNPCANPCCTHPHEDRTPPPKAASTQTNIQLPHKFLDVIWTANNLEPVVDGTENMDQILGMAMGGVIAVGVGVEDVDFSEDDFMNEGVNAVIFDADKMHEVIELNMDQQMRAANMDFKKLKMPRLI